MSAIRFRDRNGQVKEVPYLKGDPGDTPQVDQELNEHSTNAIANKAVTAELNRLQYDTSNVTYALNERINFLEEGVVYSNNRADYAHERVDAVEQQLGGIETALDGILAIQNALIGGASA